MNFERMVRSFLVIAVLQLGLLGETHAMQGTASTYKGASQTLLEEGRQAYEADAFQDALKLYETALVADPSNVDAFIAIGQAHEAMGNRGLGIQYYQRALELKPDSLKALVAESLAFLADHGLVKAEENLKKMGRLCGAATCPEFDQLQDAIQSYKKNDGSALVLDKNDG